MLSCESMSFSLFMPVAASVEMKSGLLTFLFFYAASSLSKATGLISLSISFDWLGRQQMKMISHSLTILSLLNSAITPNSYWNGLKRWGCLVETSNCKLLKLPDISRSFVRIIVPKWPHPIIPILKGGISLRSSTEFEMSWVADCSPSSPSFFDSSSSSFLLALADCSFWMRKAYL